MKGMIFMSYTNQTANYGLPQYTADDKPTYLGDFNKAMLDIDTAIKANENIAHASETLAQNANNSASEALSTANTASTTTGSCPIRWRQRRVPEEVPRRYRDRLRDI